MNEPTIRYDQIIYPSEVDGPGVRATIFVQGCPIHCPGCQNRRLWPFAGGIEAPVSAAATELLTTGLDVTISGGEPIAQAGAVAELVRLLKEQDRHVILYSGFALEDLLTLTDVIPGLDYLLKTVDILVDGPYIARLDDDTMQWRGSANQRPIDMEASREVFFQKVIEHDWDAPVLIITEDGDVLGAAAHMALFEGLGQEVETRRCGETNAALG